MSVPWLLTHKQLAFLVARLNEIQNNSIQIKIASEYLFYMACNIECEFSLFLFCITNSNKVKYTILQRIQANIQITISTLCLPS